METLLEGVHETYASLLGIVSDYMKRTTLAIQTHHASFIHQTLAVSVSQTCIYAFFLFIFNSISII